MAGTRVFPNALELRAAAARTSLERINRDLARSPVKLRPLLEHIRDHLFSPGLNVQSLKRACGVRDNSVSTVFGRTIGLPPRPYMEARRLETAERLLSDTALPVNQIGELVGFSSEAVFYRAFRRWRGIAPSTFRAEVYAKREPLAVECMRDEDVRRALRGRASTDETEALIAGLASAHQEKQQEHETVEATNDTVAVDTATESTDAAGAAESLWREIRVLDPESQRARIGELGTARLGLAELLFERSRTEGRDDRSRGVAIAKLAVECLYPGGNALEAIDVDDLATLRARAWAWLGNAYRLALDLIEADKAIEVAKRTLPASASGDAVAEVLELESGLRHYQTRYQDARDLLSTARQRGRGLLSDRRIARLLVQQATMSMHLGEVDSCIPSLRQALRLLSASPDLYLESVTYQLMVLALTKSDHCHEASQFLPASRRCALELGVRFARVSHQRLEGLVWSGLDEPARAERALSAAKSGFAELGESMSAAVVCLDLAIHLATAGKHEHAIEPCFEAIGLLKAFGAHREVLAAVSVLQGALARKALPLETLRLIREKLERAPSGARLATPAQSTPDS